ncbi:hypothetical protein niasHS_002579 [Heterodera schachtii]|uniref:Uncharacterized protein n=1 Tax=Heterodera schachtii TaxID=97005 RepID=A0ABD2KKM5_HETSC
MADQTDVFGVASSSIGKPIRVELGTGSRKTIISGNLLTTDPESGSIVLVEKRQQNKTSDQEKCSQRFILIPGSSVHSAKLVTISEGTIGTLKKEGQLEEGTKSNAELREKADGIESGDEATIESHGKRTLSETVRIFDQFALSRRLCLIDALNKYGIKFSEKPHVLVQNIDNGQAEGQMPSTVISLQSGGIKIYPPYGKSDIIGGGSIAVKELLHKLSTENVFDE